MKNMKDNKETLEKSKNGIVLIPGGIGKPPYETFLEKQGRKLFVDYGDVSLELHKEEEAFALDVFEELIKECGKEKAIEIVSTWKSAILSWENQKTVKQVVADLKANYK